VVEAPLGESDVHGAQQIAGPRRGQTPGDGQALDPASDLDPDPVAGPQAEGLQGGG
jgi:hypothetical protein